MSVLTTLLVASIPALMALIAALVVNARTLKATKPKTEAEARAIDDGSDRDDIRVSLEAMNSAIKAANDRATNAEAASERTSKRVTALENQLQDSHQQNELLAQQNGVLTKSLSAAEERNRLLLRHIELSDAWIGRHWTPGDGDRPPQLINI